MAIAVADQPVEATDRDERIESAIADWLLAADSGDAPPPDEWIAQHAEFADELHDFFATRESLDELSRPLRIARPPVVPAGGALAFGPYELLEQIGQGGMGVVYKARQVALDRLVAVKMILAGHFASDDDRRRFDREARLAGNLDHPHIVPIHEVGQHDGHRYFSMKLIEGGSLAAQPDRFCDNPRSAAEIVEVIARAVQYAHDRGVLHRDLKPSNILLDDDGQPHVVDFGLSRRLDAGTTFTEHTTRIGTPSYMAPEQVVGGRGAVDLRTDVYGLGAVLYALLTGQAPFSAAMPVETQRLLLDSEVEPPRSLNPRVDRGLEAICLKCLEKEPVMRYAAAAEVADDLRRWLDGDATVAQPLSVFGRARRWVARRRWFVLGALAIAALLGALAWERASRSPLPDEFANAPMIELDAENRGSYRGRIRLRDVDEFVGFVARKSGLLSVDVVPDEGLDTFVMFYDVQSDTNNDNRPDGLDTDSSVGDGVSHIEYEVEAGGTYYVGIGSVGASSVGEFTVNVSTLQ